MSGTINQRDFDCAPDVKVGDEIQLSGTCYIVEDIATIADMTERGLTNLAARFAQHGVHAELVCRRPRGSKRHVLRAFRTPQGQLLFRHVLSL